MRRIDYVLVYQSKCKDVAEQHRHEQRRRIFERNLEEEGLELEADIVVSGAI